VQFGQSSADFPLRVKLGEGNPSFGLHRFRQGLRFIPPDDEGFTLRGDRQRLLYKGRRRSHRFTILGDTAFEYDCILEKEPESNAITLFLEGAENFDFYRQPDFVKEPFLKGSYAVYKKETLVGEGTGKLCHIHRPEIIDARGQRCWGELAVIGNELRIAIPERFLSGAKYPVVVDPTIGTATVGSQTNWITVNNKGIQEYCLIGALGVNRFLLPETLNGAAAAYVYAFNPISVNECKPVLYSDSSDMPQYRLSSNEGYFNVSISGARPEGWRPASFDVNSSIQSGCYIWYGLSASTFFPRFDYAGKLYWYTYGNYTVNLPNTFPLFPDGRFYNYLISMYFIYPPAQNYVRTLTQGVSLSDSRRITGSYSRIAAQTVQARETFAKLLAIKKRIQDMASGFDFNSFVLVKIRAIRERIQLADTISHAKALFRALADIAVIESGLQQGRLFFRKLADNAQAFALAAKLIAVFKRIQDTASGFDYNSFSLANVRTIREGVNTADIISHLKVFIRALSSIAGIESVAKQSRALRRKLADTALAAGPVFRGLFLLVMIKSGAYMRDFVLGRLLKSKNEAVLKSCVCREIIIESRIN
jgi:hypothetical protein